MINVGIAGLGFMGMVHYLAYQKVPDAKVTALCEKDKKRLGGDWTSIKGNFGPRGKRMDLGGLDRYAEVDELVADPNLDLIDVCLPPSLHAKVSIAALEAGKHVFCEKPIALAADDAQQMVRTAQQAGRQLMIGHVLPFMPEYAFAYRTITNGQYGRPLGGHFKRMISDPQWIPDFYDPQTVGGPMIDLHVHDAHFIRVVFGMPREVRSTGSMRGQVVERFSTQFLFDESGLVVTATSGVIDQQGRPFTHGYEIYLERATLLFDLGGVAGDAAPATPVTVLTEDGGVERPELIAGDPAEVAFPEEIKEVVRAVQTAARSELLAGELARDAVVLCQRQTQSVEQRRPVKV